MVAERKAERNWPAVSFMENNWFTEKPTLPERQLAGEAFFILEDMRSGNMLKVEPLNVKIII